MAWYQVVPGPALIALPVFVLLAVTLAMGVGVYLAALNVKYRDFRYVVPFAVQLGLFVSPIAFTTADVPERWRPLYFLNPLVGIVDGFRWSILGGDALLDPRALAATVVISVGLLACGVLYFRRTERGFADVI
jgi:lipopolysaccharide transport system permease protein